MEKRRVRLYKAQEGGQPSADMLGYPGAQQEQAQQMSEEQLVQSITQDISNDLPKEAIVAKLVNVMGIDMMQASQYVESVYTMLQNQMEEPDEDEDATPQQVEQQAIEEQAIVPMNKMVMHNDLVEDDEDEDLTDLEDEDMVKYGGMPRAADGMETGWENRYEVQFPGLEAYLPSNMDEQFYNPAADIAWQAPEETISEEETIDYTQPVADPSQFSMGGFKTKKGYVNSVMKLVKKQLGGDQETESNDADPRGDDLRKSNLNAFIGSVKKEGNMSLAKQQAEEQYDQMMAMHQQQMMQPDLSAFIPQNEMGMDQAQYGGMPRQQKKAIKQMQRTLRHLPVGNVGAVSKFDVQRSGLFGSPREYSIEFDKPLVQLANNPMLNANYGYGFGTKVTRTPARVKTEYVKNVVNSEAIKEVAKATGSDAAAKATVNTDTPSATAAPVTPAAAPVVASAPAAPVTVNRPPTNTVVTPPAVTPVNPPAVNTYMPPAQFDYTPGLSNVQGNIQNFDPENRHRAGVGLKGSSDIYSFDSESNRWKYQPYNSPGGKGKFLTDQSIIDKLDRNEGTVGINAFKLKDKPGYYYRERLDGSIAKYKGDPSKHSSSSKVVSYITKKDKGWKYLNEDADKEYFPLNPKGPADVKMANVANWAKSGYKEIGGSVDNPFVNEYGNLQKFMGGGDDPSIPELTQGDIDDVYSKDTTDPYMPQAQYGGMGKALTQMYFPANMPQRQYQSQMVKGPYDRATGSALASIPGYNPNAVVKDIKVTKEGLFGKPRRYTVTYNNNPTGNPDDRRLATKPITIPQASAEGETTKEAFDNSSMDRYARQDNRKNERWDRQRKRRGYEDDSDFVPMSDEEYMAKVIANRGVAPVAPVSTEQPMPEFDPNDPAELQYQAENPYIAPNDRMPEFDPNDPAELQYQSEMLNRATVNPMVANQIQGQSVMPEFNLEDPVELEAPVNEYIRPSRQGMDYNYPLPESPAMNPQDYLFQEQTNSPEFLNSLKGKDAVDVVSAMFNRLGDMGEDMLAEEPQPIPFNAMPQYIDRPQSSMELQPGIIQPPVAQKVVNKPTTSYAGTATKPRIVANADKPKGITAAQKKELAAQEARAIARQKVDEEYNSEQNLSFEERKNRIKTSNTNEKKIAAYKLYYDQPLQTLNGRLQASFRKLEGMSLPTVQKKEKERIIYEKYYAELNKLDNSWEKRSKSIKQYGGEALDRFIPQAVLGQETPVTMENNPTAPEVDIDKDFRLPMVSAKDAFKPVYEQSKKNVQAKADFEPEEYAVDYKSKSTVNDRQGALNSFNAAARGATGIIDRLAGRKQEAQMYDNLNADNLYASDPSRDRGDYDTNSGLYRPDEEGQSWNSRSAQYGGSMYEEGGYVEGQEVYMTDDELEEFLANGGEVEYI